MLIVFSINSIARNWTIIMDHPLDGVENQGGRSVSAVATTSGANDGKKEKKGRAKHTCPFQSCSANVVHFPRHMMQVHKWAKEDTVGIINAFSLRKPKKGFEKSKLKPKICPVDNCKSVVKRLRNHLIDFHKMKRGGTAYKYYLQGAVTHEVIDLSSECTCESTDEA